MFVAEAPPFCCYGALFGAIAGVIVIILLILLVRHLTKKNKGEGYNSMYSAFKTKTLHICSGG